MCSSSAPAIPPARSWPRLQSTIPQSAGASSRATARVDIRKAPHPLALEILRQNHIPTDGLRSKSRSEFAGAGAPQLDFVITVCDQAAAEPWLDSLAFLGWVGPYSLPPFFIDRFEVTNRQYQVFVDNGGYTTRDYWKQRFVRDGHGLSWSQAMDLFRDATGRPGPSTWEGGHYPEGKADYPVSGVSWFEAAAYAEFVGKSLPVIAQGYKVMRCGSATPTRSSRTSEPPNNR